MGVFVKLIKLPLKAVLQYIKSCCELYTMSADGATNEVMDVTSLQEEIKHLHHLLDDSANTLSSLNQKVNMLAWPKKLDDLHT